MADLDYAFLADYATISEGRLTAVGASFTHVYVATLPATISFSVAGRVRIKDGEMPPSLEIEFRAPKSKVQVTASSLVLPSPDAQVYDGKVGILFSLRGDMLALYEELVEVIISVNGEESRRLAFEVASASDAE